MYFSFSIEIVILTCLVLVFLIFYKKRRIVFPLILSSFFYLGLYFLLPLVINDSSHQNINIFYVWKIKNNYAIIYGNAYKYVLWNKYLNLNQGDYFHGEYIIKDLPDSLNDSSFSLKDYFYSQNIFHLIEIQNITKFSNSKLLSGYILTFLNSIKDTNAKEFFSTILFNISFSGEIFENSKKLGILHIFVVSGFHIHLLVIIIIKILSYTKINFKYISFISFFISLFFTFLFDFSISTMRVMLFSFIYMLYWKKRSKNYLQIFSLAGIFHLILFPGIIINHSFLLSYGVTFYILYTIKNTKSIKTTNNLLVYVKNYMFFILLTNLISMPLIININYEYNIFSIFFQTIFLPFTIILYPLLFLCLFIKESYEFIGSFYVILTSLLKTINLIKMNFIFGKLNIFLLILVFFNNYILLKTFKEKNYFFSFSFFIHIVLTWIIIYYRNYLDFFYSIEFINVGNALSVFISLPFNKGNILFDAPSINNLSKREIIPFLKSKNIKRLDAIFISHLDKDHSGGEEILENAFSIKNIYTNTYRKFESININNLQIKNLNFNFKDFWSINDKSMVLDITYKKIKLLLTSDISTIAEKQFCSKKMKYDIVQIPHHGSDTSSSNCFLNSIDSKFAIVSQGEKYNLPNWSIINKWKNTSSKVYSTLYKGQISFKFYNSFSYLTFSKSKKVFFF